MDIIKGLFSKLWEEFGWFIGTLACIAVIWFWTGGANRESAHEGAYIKPLAPVDSGQIYGTYYNGISTTQKESLNLPNFPVTIIRDIETLIANFFTHTTKVEKVRATSVLSRSISFDGIAGAKADTAEAEYIRITVAGPAPEPIQISGFTLEGNSFDGGITLPLDITHERIVLGPLDRALISTGVSPVGGSFQVDLCSTYRNGASKIIPALRKSNFVGEMSYDECVAKHKNDSGFKTNEWRIFLGQSNELWNNSHDSIKLIDSKDEVVDTLTY